MKIADAHCDTLSGMLDKKENFLQNSLQINKDSIYSGGYETYLQFFAVFLSPSLPYEIGMANTRSMIKIFNDMIDEDYIKAVRCTEDLKKVGLMGLLSIEGMYFTDSDEYIVENLFDSGVRCMSLTWNPDNEYSGGILGKTGKGLTKQGKKVVRKAFEKGILVDVSHISDKGFYDIAEIASEYNKPFAATHSNARGLCHHLRNLDDSMLGVLAKSGGFTGINMYSCFLSENCEADVEDIVAHIEYICGKAGPAYVGFGTDFDGIDRKKSAIDGPRELWDVIDRLLSMNYNEDDVRNIAYGNIERVLANVLK